MEDRRVRRLRLRATRQTEARRASVVMEDALRTASLPGSEPGRLFVVRTLDIGRLPAGVSPASASRQVESKLYDVLDRAVFAAQPGAETAPAVYFSDHTQALALFARRLASGGTADEWYWSLVIPGRWHAMERREGLRRILAVAGGSLPSPAAGQAALLASLLEDSPSSFEALLGALDPEDGPPLLAQAGLQEAPPGIRLSDAEPLAGTEPAPEADRQAGLPVISSLWNTALRRWAARWRPQDARMLWLSAMALVAANPTRLAHPSRLRSTALNLQARIVEAAFPTAPGTSRSSDQPVSSALLHTTTAIEKSITQDEGRIKPDRSPASNIRGQPAGFDAADVSPRDESLLMDTSELTLIQASTREDQPIEQAADPILVDPVIGLPTQWSGLYFLLPALARLGLPNLLQAQPEFIESNLPQRILHRVAIRAGVPEGDPVLMPLEPFSKWQGDGLPFVAPLAWAGLLPQSGARAVWRLKRRGDTWMLCSRSGLPFAIWTRRAPAGAHRWLQEKQGKILRVAMKDRDVSVQQLDLVLNAWVHAVRVWIRLVSGLSLAELLRRRGRVYMTRTHLDVILPLATADLRIRRAGLDLDPGWLPWLGRVVQFKYLEE